MPLGPVGLMHILTRRRRAACCHAPLSIEVACNLKISYVGGGTRRAEVYMAALIHEG